MATTTGRATDFINFSRASNATVVASDGKIKWAPHNLLLASEQFDAASWVKFNVTVTANTVAAPNGATTAEMVSPSSIGNARGVYQSVSVTGGDYTVRVYAKPAGFDWLCIYDPSGSATGAAWFNVTTGALGTVAAGFTATAPVSVGNGWYLCSVTKTGFAAGTFYGFFGGVPSDNTVAVPGAGNGVYLWGAHLYCSDLGGMVANTSAYPMYNPTTRPNLLGYTESFDNAAWAAYNTTKATGSLTLTSTVGGAYQTITLVNGGVYTFQCKIKAGTNNFAAFNIQGNATNYATAVFNVSNGTVGETAASGSGFAVSTHTISTADADGYFTCRATFTVGAGSIVLIAFAAAATGNSFDSYGNPTGCTNGNTLFVKNAQLSDSASLDPYVPNYFAAPSAAAYHGPRLDYNPATLAPLGLLVEEQRTNLLLRSAQFDNASWYQTGITITPAATTGPDGVLSGTRIASGAGPETYQVGCNIASVPMTASIFAKYNGSNFKLSIYDNASGNLGAVFNPQAGSVVSSDAGVVASIYPAGGGWYRCSVTRTTAATLNGGITINGFTNVFLYGAQLEAGSFATSYIPTTSATVTRSADMASVATSAFPYSSTAGTVVAKYSSLVPTASGQNVVNLSDGTTNERWFVDHASGIRGYMATGGVAQAVITLGTYVAGNTYNVALAATANSVQMALDGALGTEDTSATMPTVNKMNIGSGQNVGSQLNGWIRQITYIPRRLSNADLQARTSA